MPSTRDYLLAGILASVLTFLADFVWHKSHGFSCHQDKRGAFPRLVLLSNHTFLPVTFSLLSSQNQVCGAKADVRTHSLGGESFRPSAKVVRELLVSALSQGVRVSCVLFDSWFSSPKMFHQLRPLKLHVVAMVKRSKKMYERFMVK